MIPVCPRIPEGMLVLEYSQGRPRYAAHSDGWLYEPHAMGGWVSVRRLTPEELATVLEKIK